MFLTPAFPGKRGKAQKGNNSECTVMKVATPLKRRFQRRCQEDFNFGTSVWAAVASEGSE